MKHILFCGWLLFFIHTNAYTQSFPTIVVRAGTKILDYFPYNKRYMYPEFIAGKAFFVDGSMAEGFMNYNLLLDEIQFLGGRGDTLIMTGKNNIRQVEIKDDRFYYDGGFHRLIKGEDVLKITQKHYYEFLGAEKYEAYGMTSSISSAESLQTFLPGGGSYTDLVIAENLKFKETVEYFITTDGEKYHLINKTALKRQFPLYKKAIIEFLKDHDVDFNDESDLLELYGFLSGLSE